MTIAIADLWVDSERCLGHFLCVDLAPILFKMNDEGWAARVRPTDVRSLSAADVDAVFAAAANCPVGAIKVKVGTGEILTADSAALRSWRTSRSR